MTVLLEVRDLTVTFGTGAGAHTAVDGLTYRLDRGETYGVVGESGAGKSVTARALLGLIDGPGRIDRGMVRLHDSAIVDAFETDFPDHVVDLETIRAEYDLETLLRRLDDRGVTASAITGSPDDHDRSAVELTAADNVDVADLVGCGLAAEVGVVDPDAFVVIDGERRYLEVLRAPEAALRRLRGNHVALVFQDAGASLDPVYSVGEQIAETIRHHLGYDESAARERAIELLDRVGIPDAHERYASYPHELSGGMVQRVAIAVALSCDPALVICDEPTTGLDVTIQAQLLDLLEELAAESDTTFQLITHDLGVVASVCDRVQVLYAGQAVETAPVEDLFYDPKHPYTVGLLSAIPRLGVDRDRLRTIPGSMPNAVAPPPGCRFHPRCPYAETVCAETAPTYLDLETNEVAAATSDRAARCLAHTGDLDGDLEYAVRVRDDVRGGGAGDGTGTGRGTLTEDGDTAGGDDVPDVDAGWERFP